MLTNVSTLSPWPHTISIPDLVALAKRRLGARYLSVKRYHYATSSQIEVRSRATHYDGSTYFKREACYTE